MFFINLLFERFWILSNSLFPQIPERIKRKKKKNEYLPMNNNDIKF
jgi:hypothetical protein